MAVCLGNHNKSQQNALPSLCTGRLGHRFGGGTRGYFYVEPFVFNDTRFQCNSLDLERTSKRDDKPKNAKFFIINSFIESFENKYFFLK